MSLDLRTTTSLSCDVLIIGGGGAALRAAIEARKRNVEVVLISKSRIGYGNNTAMAGSLIAAATGWREPKDSAELHFQDTVRGGRFINNQKMVETMVRCGIEEINNLEKYGVNFRKRNGGFSVLWVPGHTYPRSLLTINTIGTDFTLPLSQQAQEMGCKFIDKILITRLLKKDGAVVGALGLDEKGVIYIFNTKTIILATGGFSQIFARTDNAIGTTGDGIMLAFEAGASLADMEFTQFYPTGIGERGGRNVVYEILVAAEGGKLRNNLGEDILEKYDIKDFVLMTRDVVSRAIAKELWADRGIGSFVTLDLASISDERLKRLAPSLPQGISQEKRTMLVAPGAHFTCGGVKTDEVTKTEVDGLFAAGEVCAGVHGANRVATNALTEIFVFGAIAGKQAAEHALKARSVTLESDDVSQGLDELKHMASRKGKEDPQEIHNHLKQVMWHKVGLMRSEQSLSQALVEIESLRRQIEYVSVSDTKELGVIFRLDKMLTISEMVTRTAAKRTESRGVHYRIDYSEPNDKEWLMNILINKQGERMCLSTTPVLLSMLTPG